MSDDKKKPKEKETDDDRQKAKEDLEHDLEALRQMAAEARQRGDIEKAEKIEKGIAWIERGGRRGH